VLAGLAGELVLMPKRKKKCRFCGKPTEDGKEACSEACEDLISAVEAIYEEAEDEKA
jgi:hypothetical protein